MTIQEIALQLKQAHDQRIESGSQQTGLVGAASMLEEFLYDHPNFEIDVVELLDALEKLL